MNDSFHATDGLSLAEVRRIADLLTDKAVTRVAVFGG